MSRHWLEKVNNMCICMRSEESYSSGGIEDQKSLIFPWDRQKISFSKKMTAIDQLLSTYYVYASIPMSKYSLETDPNLSFFVA